MDSELRDRTTCHQAAASALANPAGRGRATAALISVCLGFFVIQLDVTIVNVALPAIQHQIGGSLAGLQWVVDAYTLALASIMLTAGSTADRIGARKTFTFGLAAFAGTAAVRQLVLAARRQGARGLLGRANGGMVVHLGVVIIAVAFAASQSYGHSGEFRLRPGQSANVAGHHVTYLGTRTVRHPNKTSITARVRIDGGRVYAPAIHEFPFASQGIGSPSVRSGLRDDVYLTLVQASSSSRGPAVIGVFVQPLVAWLWIGGALMGVGTVLAAWPGRRRRRPTDPASVPIPEERVPEPAVVA